MKCSYSCFRLLVLSANCGLSTVKIFLFCLCVVTLITTDSRNSTKQTIGKNENKANTFAFIVNENVTRKVRVKNSAIARNVAAKCELYSFILISVNVRTPPCSSMRDIHHPRSTWKWNGCSFHLTKKSNSAEHLSVTFRFSFAKYERSVSRARTPLIESIATIKRKTCVFPISIRWFACRAHSFSFIDF